MVMSDAIDFENYFDRTIRLQVEFDLARKGLTAFSTSQPALEEFARREFEETRELLSSTSKRLGFAAPTWLDDNTQVTAFIERQKTRGAQSLATLEGRLRQNEYILHVAIFEGFLKEIHRRLLVADPRLLREGREVPLGKLVSKGYDAVLAEEIEREVQSLDRLSTEKKEQYFTKHIGFDWFEGHIGPLLNDVVRIRNDVLHVNADRNITAAEFELMRFVTMTLTMYMVHQAASRFPEHFVPLGAMQREHLEHGRMSLGGPDKSPPGA